MMRLTSKLSIFTLGHHFVSYYLGQTASVLGSAMAPIAITFAVLDVTGGNTFALAIVLSAKMIPFLVFLLIGGVISDRFSRRTLLLISDLGSAITQFIVAYFLFSHHFNLFLISSLEFLNGFISAFAAPARKSLLPEIVSPSNLQKANAYLSTSKNLSMMLGPALAGLIIAHFGSTFALAIDSLSYFIAFYSLLIIPKQVFPAKTNVKKSLLSDLRDGWEIFYGTRWIFSVTMVFFLINMIRSAGWQIIAPKLANELFNASGWGYLLASRGAGMIVGSMILTKLSHIHYLLRLGIITSSLGSLGFFALGLHLPFVICLLATFLGGIGSGILVITWDTSLQTFVEKQYLSRVAAFDNFFSFLAIPLGQMYGGILGSQSSRNSLELIVTICGIGYIFATLSPLCVKEVRDLKNS